jgi:hypothetical protein
MNVKHLTIVKDNSIQTRSKDVEPKDQYFDNILKETLARSSVKDTDLLKTGAAIPVLLSFNGGAVPESEKYDLLNKADKLLGLLEDYREKIANPVYSLKEVYPIIKSIEEENQRLIPLVDSLPDGESMKDFLHRLLVTSTVETIKYNRGDYI